MNELVDDLDDFFQAYKTASSAISSEEVFNYYEQVYKKKPEVQDEDNDPSYDKEYIKNQLGSF